MEIHAPQDASIKAQVDRLVKGYKKPAEPVQFQDPIREFNRVSRYEGTVRNWLTLPIDERKRIVKEAFDYVPQQPEEEKKEFENRQLERWRALSVIIQEESRVRLVAGEFVKGSVEIAIGALKALFPEHDWKPAPAVPVAK
jgi:hypothetical protein